MMDIKTTKIYEDETYIVSKLEIEINGVVEISYIKLNKSTNVSVRIDEPQI